MAAEKGMTRSCYGVREYSPEEIKEQWREFMRVCDFTFVTVTLHASLSHQIRRGRCAKILIPFLCWS